MYLSIDSKDLDESGYGLGALTQCPAGSRAVMAGFSQGTHCYLAVSVPCYPTLVWIYSIERLALVAVLHQLSPVRSTAWFRDSLIPSLAILTSSGSSSNPSMVYVWQEEGALCLPQPTVNEPRRVAPLRSESLLIAGTDSLCIAVPDWASF